MSAAPATLRVGEMLKLRIAIGVDENLVEIDNVTLPDLAGFTTLGDERRCESTGHGTECVEILSLAPTVPGDPTIGPAALDAIDARTGKPSRFASNSVTVHVRGSIAALATPLAERLLKPLLVLVLVGAVAYALLWGFGRRPKPLPVAKPAPLPVTSRPERDPLIDLIGGLHHERTRARVFALRDELRRRVGAKEEETLADLFARDAPRGNAVLAEILRRVEHAAFVDESGLQSAIEAALDALRLLPLSVPPVE